MNANDQGFSVVLMYNANMLSSVGLGCVESKYTPREVPVLVR